MTNIHKFCSSYAHVTVAISFFTEYCNVLQLYYLMHCHHVCQFIFLFRPCSIFIYIAFFQQTIFYLLVFFRCSFFPKDFVDHYIFLSCRVVAMDFHLNAIKLQHSRFIYSSYNLKTCSHFQLYRQGSVGPSVCRLERLFFLDFFFVFSLLPRLSQISHLRKI